MNKKKTFLHVHGNSSWSDADYDAGTLLLAIYPRKTSHKEILYQRRGVSQYNTRWRWEFSYFPVNIFSKIFNFST